LFPIPEQVPEILIPTAAMSRSLLTIMPVFRI